MEACSLYSSSPFFKTFECFSSTFQGKFNFQGLYKTKIDFHNIGLLNFIKTILKSFGVL